MTEISYSVEETEKAGEKLAEKLKAGDILALDGDLGAGKTAFARGVARGLGVTAHVTSPTFAIVHTYKGRLPFFHFDMYRLESAEELYDIGWEDYLASGGVILIEWAEKVGDAIPPEAMRIRITREGDTTRLIDYLDREGSS